MNRLAGYRPYINHYNQIWIRNMISNYHSSHDADILSISFGCISYVFLEGLCVFNSYIYAHLAYDLHGQNMISIDSICRMVEMTSDVVFLTRF